MKMKKLFPRGVVLAIFFLAGMLFTPVAGNASNKVVAVEGASYDVTHPMTDNLTFLMGKKISVTIGSGKTMVGYVKQVGDHLLHLEKLEGKDYFDALIRIDEISAIETRFREIRR